MPSKQGSRKYVDLPYLPWRDSPFWPMVPTCISFLAPTLDINSTYRTSDLHRLGVVLSLPEDTVNLACLPEKVLYHIYHLRPTVAALH